MRISLAILLLATLLPAPASGNPERVAVVVGNNWAGPARSRLQYAERDARRVDELLRELGGVNTTHLLLGENAGELKAVLDRLTKNLKGDGESAVVFFYYSGHADESALLMGGSRYEYRELRSALSSLGSKVVVAFIDACQSGRLARGKGAAAVPMVDVNFESDQAYEGRVFITSSSAHERSQESDDLQASVFTHYLLAGLRGAADDSGDRTVSLEEAYRYAYERTLERTSGTFAGSQHPTYEIDLTGHGEFVLTRLEPTASYLLWPESSTGTYHVLARPAGRLVAELTKTRARRLRLALSPGVYEIRKRTPPFYETQRITVRAGKTVTVDDSLGRKKRMEIAGYKGDPTDSRRLYRLAYRNRTGFLRDASLAHGVQAGLGTAGASFEYTAFLHWARAGYARSDGIDVSLDTLALGAAVDFRLLEWRRLRLTAGVDLSAGWAWQQGSRGSAEAEELSGPLFEYSGRLGAQLRVIGPVRLGAWGHLGQVVVEKTEGLAAPVAGAISVGISLEH